MTHKIPQMHQCCCSCIWCHLVPWSHSVHHHPWSHTALLFFAWNPWSAHTECWCTDDSSWDWSGYPGTGLLLCIKWSVICMIFNHYHLMWMNYIMWMKKYISCKIVKIMPSIIRHQLDQRPFFNDFCDLMLTGLGEGFQIWYLLFIEIETPCYWI